jgi:polysaccharide export outer membrane protein
MRSRFLFSALMAACCAVPCAAQFGSPPPLVPPPNVLPIDEALLTSLLTAKRPEMRFQIDDVINVGVYGPGGLGPPERIQQDGSIRFPFIGAVQVAGLTTNELEVVLEEKLKAQGIYKSPQVSVNPISEPWATVAVEGDVEKPGVFPAFGDQTLNQYLSLAGGLQDNLVSSNLATNSSASSVVTLFRPSIGHPVSIPVGPNPEGSMFGEIPLFPGDEIRVGRVGQVYAVGAFKIQGAFSLKNTSPTTVIQLMAQAGGIGFEGERGKTSIIRTEGLKQYVMKIDIAKILKGKMPDIALQPNDILFVPTNEMRAAIKGGGTGYLVALADNAVLSVHP